MNTLTEYPCNNNKRWLDLQYNFDVYNDPFKPCQTSFKITRVSKLISTFVTGVNNKIVACFDMQSNEALLHLRALHSTDNTEFYYHNQRGKGYPRPIC
jgi:hypothetical protein